MTTMLYSEKTILNSLDVNVISRKSWKKWWKKKGKVDWSTKEEWPWMVCIYDACYIYHGIYYIITENNERDDEE